jgi:hypothetical protein
LPDGGRQQDRLTFAPLAGGRVHRLWEQSQDSGRRLTVFFDGTYVPRRDVAIVEPTPDQRHSVPAPRALRGAGSGGHRNTSASTSDGVLNTSVCRGRPFSPAAILADNIASARTIERNGGVLEGIRDTARPVRRYWIPCTIDADPPPRPARREQAAPSRATRGMSAPPRDQRQRRASRAQRGRSG